MTKLEHLQSLVGKTARVRYGQYSSGNYVFVCAVLLSTKEVELSYTKAQFTLRVPLSLVHEVDEVTYIQGGS